MTLYEWVFITITKDGCDTCEIFKQTGEQDLLLKAVEKLNNVVRVDINTANDHGRANNMYVHPGFHKYRLWYPLWAMVPYSQWIKPEGDLTVLVYGSEVKDGRVTWSGMAQIVSDSIIRWVTEIALSKKETYRKSTNEPFGPWNV